jgi:ATP-dependent protease ClpP protease subunit
MKERELNKMKNNWKSTYKIKSARDDDEEEDQPQRGEQYLSYAERQVNLSQITVPIDEPIRGAKYYRQVCYRISQLSEHDSVKFIINSPGGDLDGLVSILHAMKASEVETHAEITGICHSAASMLALSCDNIFVSPYATMMVHYVSFGAIGQGAHVRDRVKHTLDFTEALFKDTYSGFLTDSEISEVIEGKELWMGAEEISKRLERLIEYRNKEEEEDDEEDYPVIVHPLDASSPINSAVNLIPNINGDYNPC